MATVQAKFYVGGNYAGEASVTVDSADRALIAEASCMFGPYNGHYPLFFTMVTNRGSWLFKPVTYYYDGVLHYTTDVVQPDHTPKTWVFNVLKD